MTVVKICGIRTIEEAFAAIEAGADYLGFNFFDRSPRYVEPRVCANIGVALAAKFPQVRRVGVFVNASAPEMRTIMQACCLDLAQLHGDETPDRFAQLGTLAYKAFRGVPKSLEGYERTDPPALLVDASIQDGYGGSGVRADWAGAARLAEHVPLMLAGGLTAENVGEAVRQVKPWGVDVASGVESAPGKKDPQRMRAFVEAVRRVERKVQAS